VNIFEKSNIKFYEKMGRRKANYISRPSLGKGGKKGSCKK